MLLLYVEICREVFTQYLVEASKLEVLFQGQALFDEMLIIREVPDYLTSFLIEGWTDQQWFEAVTPIEDGPAQASIPNP